MRLRSWSLAGLTASGLFLVVAGCGRNERPAPIRIGVLERLAAAEQTLPAARLAASLVNAAGGLDVGGRRHRVELHFEDTRGEPDVAIDRARRLIQGDVVAIVGPGRSRNAIAVAGVAENARVPLISPNSTHPETTAGKRYAFRMTCTDGFQGRAMARFATEDLEAASAAVLYDVANVYSRSLATVFQHAFERAGGKVSAFETYTTGESDFSRQLQRIREARPEVLFLPNYQEEVPVQARQAREEGIDAVLLGSDSWALASLAESPQFEGAFFGLHWHFGESDATPEARRFVSEYRAAYGHDPSDLAALTYDAFGVLFSAIRSAGTDPDRIRQALADLEGYRGVTGVISYRGTGGDPPKRLIIGQVKRGEVVGYQAVEPLSTP